MPAPERTPDVAGVINNAEHLMQLALTYALAGILALAVAYFSGRASGGFFLYVLGGIGFLLAAAGQYFKTKRQP